MIAEKLAMEAGTRLSAAARESGADTADVLHAMEIMVTAWCESVVEQTSPQVSWPGLMEDMLQTFHKNCLARTIYK